MTLHGCLPSLPEAPPYHPLLHHKRVGGLSLHITRARGDREVIRACRRFRRSVRSAAVATSQPQRGESDRTDQHRPKAGRSASPYRPQQDQARKSQSIGNCTHASIPILFSRAMVALAAVLMVRRVGTTAVPDRFIVAGLKLQLAFAGRPEQANVTCPENPATPVTLMGALTHPASNANGSAALPFVIPRACDFSIFSRFCTPTKCFPVPSKKASS